MSGEIAKLNVIAMWLTRKKVSRGNLTNDGHRSPHRQREDPRTGVAMASQ